jgi:hypothetical protein
VQLLGQLGAPLLAHGVDALRVHALQLLGDVGLARRCQHQFLEGRVQRRVAQRAAQRVGQRCVQHLGPGRCARQQQAAQHQALAGFPAVEGVAVVCQQRQAAAVVQAVVQPHRAEKPRSSEGTGGCAMPSKCQLCSAVSSTSRRSGASTLPSAPSRPMATGMTKGCFSGCPGEGSLCWLSVSV